MRLVSRRGVQYRGGEAHEIEDAIVVETTFRILLNGEEVAAQVASDEQLAELGAGFVIDEGLADAVDSVSVEGDAILVAAPRRCAAGTETGSSGGVSFRCDVRRVQSDLTVTPGEVQAVTEAIFSEDWQRTGALHCSVLICDGRLVAKACDVGRHNSVDKVVGTAVLAGIDRSRCVIACTGRQPSGMVKKAANAGIPVLVSRAASTDQGIATAEVAGVTLVCFSRGDRFTIYTHPERIVGPPA
ncbi:MAG: formate dehydrogenase accessory sulfurtransferase FdhD [Methanospirillum sp.]